MQLLNIGSIDDFPRQLKAVLESPRIRLVGSQVAGDRSWLLQDWDVHVNAHAPFVIASHLLGVPAI